MQTLDLIRQRRIDFMFKHALVRDALYQSLLSEARTALALIVIE
jgi:predicted ATPase